MRDTTRSTFAEIPFLVQRERNEDGTMTGRWVWTVETRGKSFSGTEASQTAAINAAQEQCGIAPAKRTPTL